MEWVTEKDIDGLLESGHKTTFQSILDLKRMVSKGSFGIAIFPDKVLGSIKDSNCHLGRKSDFGWDCDSGTERYITYEVVEILGNKMICWVEKAK